MDTDFKAPTGLIYDVSDMKAMLDGEGNFSPLVVRYVLERDLVEKLGLSVVSDIPQYPSLKQQYRDVRTLLSHFNLEFHTQLPESIVGMLRTFVISVELIDDLILITLLRPLKRTH